VGSFLAWLAANRGATDLDPGPLRGAGSQAAGTSDTAAGPDEGGTEACDAVTLATFHQAKGLEWPTVAVVGLEEGTVPIVHATSSETLAEERRLLYVAVTRAESRLWCSWAAVSSSTRGARRRRPSPLLGPLRAVLAEQAPLQPDAALARLGALRERLAAAG
jgi:DNA helicase-2/ATP-dependent DNA helicase PcrA